MERPQILKTARDIPGTLPVLSIQEAHEVLLYALALEVSRDRLWTRVVNLADECDEAWGAEYRARADAEELAEALDEIAADPKGTFDMYSERRRVHSVATAALKVYREQKGVE